MRARTIVLLGLLLTWGLATPLRAQRLGNSSLDFYDQGLQRLEQEIQRLQVEPAKEKTPLLTSPTPSPQPIQSTPLLTPPTSKPSPPPATNSDRPSS